MEKFEILAPTLSCNCDLGESPLWDARRQSLVWVDINRGFIHELEIQTNIHRFHDLGQKVGCLALSKNGKFLLATDTGFSFWHPSEGFSGDFLQVYRPDSGLMFNDGKVDRNGNFWIGSKGPKTKASLFVLKPNGDLEVKIPQITISNGLDWSLDNRTFYHTDSAERTIYRYEFDPETLTLTNRDTFYTPPVGSPDGLIVDSIGNLWVAIWDGSRVVYLNPEGKELAEIKVPVSRPTSVALGGPELKMLFITSAQENLGQEELRFQPAAGDLFSLEVPIPGRRANLFG